LTNVYLYVIVSVGNKELDMNKFHHYLTELEAQNIVNKLQLKGWKANIREREKGDWRLYEVWTDAPKTLHDRLGLLI
jgi:hypothetical protein